MNALGMVLKALGVNVTEDSVRQMEALIPQLPGRLQQAVDVVNRAVAETHTRLDKIENSIAGLAASMEEERHARGSNGNGKRGGYAKSNGAGR